MDVVNQIKDPRDAAAAVYAQLFLVKRVDFAVEGDFTDVCLDVDSAKRGHSPANEVVDYSPLEVAICLIAV